jgi:hypothetical protein
LRKPLLIVIIGLLLVFFAFSFFPLQAKATDPDSLSKPYIHICDANGNLRTEFAKGEQLRIVTFYPFPVYQVKVINPDGKVLFSKWSLSEDGKFDSGLLSDLTGEMGSWKVEAGIFFFYEVKIYFVVPIAPFGVLGMFAACFTGFGIKYAKGRKTT